MTLVGVVALPRGADAIEPTELQAGLVFSIGACLDGNERACQDVGSRVGDKGWETAIGLPQTGARRDLRTLALRCATGDASGCSELADKAERTDRDDRALRASMLRLRACSLGDAEACTVWFGDAGAPADGLVVVGAHVGEWRQADSEDFGWAKGAPGADTVSTILDGCANDEQGWRCGALGRVVALAGTELDPDWSGTRLLATDCLVRPDGLACTALGQGSPWPGEMEGDRQLLDHLCRRGGATGEGAGACRASAALADLGLPTGWGSFDALAAWGLACDGGDEPSCELLTSSYLARGGQRIEGACGRVLDGLGGDPRACGEAARMTFFGTGLEQDEELSVQLEAAACDRGDARACGWRAAGEATDWPVRQQRLQQACDAGDLRSCSVLARAELVEDSDTQQARALELLVDLCARGEGASCGELARLRHEGEHGVPVDAVRSVQLAERACALGEIEACGLLGEHYLAGRGVPDHAERGAWLVRLACTEGSDPHCRTLAELTPKVRSAAVPPRFPARRYDGRPSKAPWLLEPGDEGDDEAAAETNAADVEEPVDPEEPPDPEAVEWREGPPPPPPPRAFLSGSLGTSRSWVAPAQGAVIRVTAGMGVPWLIVAGEVDWLTDNRWRGRLAQTYARVGVRGFAALAIQFTPATSIWVGGGGGIGIYQQGNTASDVQGSLGAVELVQFNLHFGVGFMGLRIEQQQLWQPDESWGLDHVTSALFTFGGFLGG